ncbi:hypothetical protein FRC08_000196 [Ceratobasidium sp. 394]|nr:hypothetical protein FRC08_000196 [Ceratobasidium sp. 394]
MVEPIKPEDDNNNAPWQDVVLPTFDTTSNDNREAAMIDPTRPESSADRTTDDETSSTVYADQSRVSFLVEGQRFIVHASKAREFDEIDGMMENRPEGAGMQVIELQESAEKFAMMLKVLYTPVYRATTFDVDTLVSTLTLATKYGHPDLREYAISVLGPRRHELSPVERIRVSRTCEVDEWTPDAIDELSKRPELLTLDEATELGDDVFKAVSGKREQVNPGNRPKKNVVCAVAWYICMGFGCLLFFLALLFIAGKGGAAADDLFRVVMGILGDVTVKVRRSILRVVVGHWMAFDPIVDYDG